jgi:hypothetical protein
VHNCGTKGAKVVKIDIRKEKLSADNRETLEILLRGHDVDPALCAMLRVIADVFDLVANGTDAVCFFGGTTDHSAVSMGVKIDRSKTAVYADGLLELGTKAESLL